jgi:hypothetical protein
VQVDGGSLTAGAVKSQVHTQQSGAKVVASSRTAPFQALLLVCH